VSCYLSQDSDGWARKASRRTCVSDNTQALDELLIDDGPRGTDYRGTPEK
jgi:hypothetical protein